MWDFRGDERSPDLQATKAASGPVTELDVNAPKRQQAPIKSLMG
jgi:hypothetical protein